jgi:hypothetical protein
LAKKENISAESGVFYYAEEATSTDLQPMLSGDVFCNAI